MTSKRNQGVLVAVLALLWSLGIATAAGATSGDILYIQGETASVHQDPSKSAPVLIQLNRGHKVMEIERQGAWVRIRMFHTIKKGWVRSSFLAPRFPGETTVASPQPKAEEGRVAVFSAKLAVPRGVDVVEREILIEVTGPFLHAFNGECRIETVDGGTRLVKLGGRIPKTFLIKATNIDTYMKCTFRKKLFDRHNKARVKIIVDGQVLEDKTFQ